MRYKPLQEASSHGHRADMASMEAMRSERTRALRRKASKVSRETRGVGTGGSVATSTSSLSEPARVDAKPSCCAGGATTTPGARTGGCE
jgi:hypothetical protein